ncbi:MAG TPA: hypothetical protein VLA72_05075, partial [Anaerolineales bacterium]|nr:hypothetical protein [Anaerolineales bacterium]
HLTISSCLAKILEKVTLFTVFSPDFREGWGSEQIHVGAQLKTLNIIECFFVFLKLIKQKQ